MEFAQKNTVENRCTTLAFESVASRYLDKDQSLSSTSINNDGKFLSVIDTKTRRSFKVKKKILIFPYR